jgi:predicted nucleic acid-binding protein
MSIVSNTSPIINLAFAGLLDLLPQLYGNIVIPHAVWEEIVVQGEGQPGAAELQQAAWVQVSSVNNRELVDALRQELDAGEAEAIALAMQLRAEILLMDERLGRETAHHLGLHCVGLIGVLVEAKHKSLIPAIQPHLDLLRTQAGFRLSELLYRQVLNDANEPLAAHPL